MWILNFLPDWIFYLTAIVGVAALVAARFASFIPLLAPYKLPVSIGGFLVLLISMWFIGGAANEEKWQARVKELEAKIAVAEEKSKDENVKIETKVVQKIDIVKVRGEEIIQYVDREVKVFDASCVIPKPFIEAHNRAAEPVK